ncbi:C1QL [Mytilus edulis]|uniref:C1QL n=1 Tax=Mytilus edulis TaxID=6550 RepID=A0A8S3UDH7_MYTED|nr:C1QL [Mytilus edulis]
MFVALPVLVQGLLILIFICKAETNEDKIAAMLSRLEVVEKKVEQVEKENEALKKENKRINEKLETCECANSQTDIDVKGPGETAQVKYTNQKNLNRTTSLSSPSSVIQHVKTLHLGDHKRNSRKRLFLGTASTTTATTTRMAFLAGLSKPITSLGSHQAIDYDLVLTNEGQAYDSLHGHMVAPVKEYKEKKIESREKENKEIRSISEDGRNYRRITTPTATSASMQVTNPMAISFTASLSKTITLGSGQAIAYDMIMENCGNAYNEHSGHFTAPVSGIYLVSAGIVAEPGKRVAIDFFLNGTFMLVTMYVDARSISSFAYSFKTFPIFLRKGDNIWLQGRADMRAAPYMDFRITFIHISLAFS